MAIIRENARFGAALIALFATGCVSTDESLFRSVEGPEERTELLSPVTSGAPGGVSTPPRAEQLPATLGLGPSMAMEGESAEPAPTSSADEASIPGDESEVAMVPFDPCDAPGLLSCVTFEDAPSGEFPSGEPWLEELAGCGTHVVDETVAGPYDAKALRADGGGYPECMLHMDLRGETDVFVRSWIRVQPELLDQYVTLLELGPEAARDEPEVRIGSRPNAGSLCSASPGLDLSVSGLASGSATDCTGFTLSPERWYCVQAHVTRSGTSLGVSLSVDGEVLIERSYESLNPPWNTDGFYLKLGRAAYGSSGPGSLWHDDVAVGLEPPPCGP